MTKDYFPEDRPITNQDFAKALAWMTEAVDNLNCPRAIYGALHLRQDGFEFFAAGAKQIELGNGDVLSWLQNYQDRENAKIIAVTLIGEGSLQQLAARLWLELDIVCFFAPDFQTPLEIAAAQTNIKFDKDNIVNLEIDDFNEVHPSFLVTVDDYQRACSPEEWQQLNELVKRVGKQRLLFISATPQGGGVSLMRHGLMRLLRQLGVDAHWHVMTENERAFQITKTKFHNVLQGVADPSVRLSDDDKVLFEEWSQENAELIAPAIKQASMIVIDDPQPSGLIPHIKEINPHAKLIYRSHIQIDTQLLNDPNSAQSQTWNYIWNYAQHADKFVAHPVDAFIPAAVPADKVIKMPPSTDPIDGLNKNLTDQQLDYHLRLFNQMLLLDHQLPLDTNRPYLIQIARFDPSKGIPDVLESYRLLREKLGDKPPAEVPQLVIMGHGSIDDPDGRPLLLLTKEMLDLPMYQHLKSDVKIMRAIHFDQLFNTMLRRALVVMQLSHREGYEIKVTEALLKGKPVIAYRAGGIPLQIKAGENGVVLDNIGDTSAVAEELYKLVTDGEHYRQFSEAATQQARRDVLTIPNAIRWLEMAV